MKNSKIVGAGVLDSPFYTIMYDFFDKLWAHIVRPFPVRTVDLQNAGDIHASRFSKYNVMLRKIFVGAAFGGPPDILCYCKDCQRPSLQNHKPIMGGSYPPLRISVTTVFMAERRGRTLCAPTETDLCRGARPRAPTDPIAPKWNAEGGVPYILRSQQAFMVE